MRKHYPTRVFIKDFLAERRASLMWKYYDTYGLGIKTMQKEMKPLDEEVEEYYEAIKNEI